ncbi:MAG: hypothetical protein HY540_00485 [Deltaproteobacteria bacterium]|nr:hypothetical protein [Deltaproteobacteria bacterium]
MKTPSLPSLLICGTAMIFIAVPLTASALCLENCVDRKPEPLASMALTSPQDTTIEPQMRERSHNTADVKNSVMGDVNIRVGHEKLEIRSEGTSHSNTVDASIQSTIILGDMKQ